MTGHPAQLAGQTWMTTREAAAYARCSAETIKRAVAAKALKSSQATPGGWHRFRRDWVDEWMENRGRLPKLAVVDGRRPRVR